MKMKKCINKIAIFVSLMITSSAIGFTASAVAIWDAPYTVGYTTYYNGHSASPIYSESKITDHMSSNYTHTTAGNAGQTTLWILTAVNLDSYSRFISASTNLYNKYTESYVTGYWDNSNGSTNAHSTKTAISNIPTSSLSSQYELHYDSNIRGGDSQYSPIIEDVHFEEALN